MAAHHDTKDSPDQDQCPPKLIVDGPYSVQDIISKIATGNIHILEISTTDATAQDIATILQESAHVHTLSLISIRRHQINPTAAMDLVNSHFRAVAATRNTTNPLSLAIEGIAIPYSIASISVSTSHPESPTITSAPAPRNVTPK